MINLNLDADLKKYIQCFKLSFPFEKMCSAMSASVSLPRTQFCTCESLGSSSVKMSQAFHDPRSASTFYTTERLTRLKLLKCAFTQTRTFEPDVLQLFLRDLFIILRWMVPVLRFFEYVNFERKEKKSQLNAITKFAYDSIAKLVLVQKRQLFCNQLLPWQRYLMIVQTYF